ncbi:hypothetical protein [Kribbella sp. NPDC006257]|uniref:hypothetical protein n=1 Tax=Kribbella sp. NPDC006257 TaxID=3156738 RepID=UPI0033BD7FF2
MAACLGPGIRVGRWASSRKFWQAKRNPLAGRHVGGQCDGLWKALGQREGFGLRASKFGAGRGVTHRDDQIPGELGSGASGQGRGQRPESWAYDDSTPGQARTGRRWTVAGGAQY